MAFNEGVLKDGSSLRKWDGKDYGNQNWNQDQTAKTWLTNSVVWFSQRLTTQIGMEKLKQYLFRFGYGNQDLSGGLTKAWLDSSLKISPEEQIELLRAIWERRVSVSVEAVEKTISILPAETFLGGTLKGKTGASGWYSETGKQESYAGWYVGYFFFRGRDYALSSSYVGPRKSGDSARPGLVAEQLAKSVLAEKFLVK